MRFAKKIRPSAHELVCVWTLQGKSDLQTQMTVYTVSTDPHGSKAHPVAEHAVRTVFEQQSGLDKIEIRHRTQCSLQTRQRAID